MSLNKAMIIGNLGSDPEVRYTQSGAAVANFNIATNETWMDKSGAKQERTEWHRVVVFGKQAENCGKYLSKGRQVYVEGRMQTRDWEDRDGNKRSTTEIVAQTVQFLSSGNAAGRSDGPSSYGDSNRGGSSGAAESSFDQSFNDDDIPF
ncbi:single-stranded DNA-binding protein [Bradymonadaceae bacterium TMQ3]|uniref:Single-stranded DNA-binding protein n=1 Tax=Lujinxingia sediminis TaxID=2480984 RepID=A0ABY0CPY6_9DELT|nr:single-stranded DNA-binding protein [Lujinxingia sediminis]RDV36542.1 single-stranded DNA-binding protein [Bradymonadaceae bacterium TMQ3]RVU42393.1 single-stranded DNA-binding protein [Lujinxingia sediminis]TXC74592.1 single-stranded DNA-binding protein [Bradymonadales bacterium TMQ1]